MGLILQLNSGFRCDELLNSYISRGEYKNRIFSLVEKLGLRRYIHLARRPIWHFWCLVTKLATFAIPARKNGEQFLNEFFHYSGDITPSPGILKWWRKIFLTACIQDI